MTDFNLKDFLKEHKATRVDSLDQSIQSIMDHKFGSHERLFRLLLNLNTLALTGWVGLATWKSQQFLIDTTVVFRACEYHIASLVLISISDLCVLIHSSLAEWLFKQAKEKWIASFARVEAKLVGLTNAIGNDPHILAGEADKALDDLDKELNEPKAVRVVKISRIAWGATWLFGTLGFACFFFALLFSIRSMVSFVRPGPGQAVVAESSQSSPAPSPSATSSPLSIRVEHQTVSKSFKPVPEKSE